MHELAIVQSVVEAIHDRLGDAEVATVRLAVGTSAGVVVDSIRFSFDVLKEDTSLAGATLVIDEPPGNDLRIVSVEVWTSCATPAGAPTTPESG
jgi:hydrogenase nickel incorporation protein HypA/HybF